MRLLTSSQLLGVLLILASVPVDAAATTAAPGSVEARMQRISAALQAADPAVDRAADRLGQDAVSWWRNGGFRDGGFRNGGFRDGGFRNGGFGNGGFRNGFWVNI